MKAYVTGLAAVAVLRIARIANSGARHMPRRRRGLRHWLPLQQ